MFLLKKKTNTEGNKTIIRTNQTLNDASYYVQKLRLTEEVLTPDEITTGGYYIYKEKFGIVALVKVLEDMSTTGWAGYRVMIKRVLYSPWQIPKNAVLEIGFSTNPTPYPPSWHFEPGIMLVKCDRRVSYDENYNTEIESVL